MNYPLIPSRQQKRLLAILAATHIFPGDGATAMTTSEVMAEMPDNPSRKRVVASLRALADAGYIYETYVYAKSVTAVDIVMQNQAAHNGRLIAWELTPTGLRVALGVLA